MNAIRIVAGIILLLMAVLMFDTMYVVDETEQVVITQFGEPIGRPITKAGLYFKIPLFQTVNRFDKRILSWDGDANQITTFDIRYIWVETTARWRIVDALKFMQSVGSEAGAHTRLDDIIDAATRDAISNAALVEVVRNSNRILERKKKASGDEIDAFTDAAALDEVDVGRVALTRKILESASKNMTDFGVELVDVRIKRITYLNEVLVKVYDRMISERKRAAEQYRSEGQGEKAKIEGRIQRELEQINSEAYEKAQEIKGKADAEAIEIYAGAYNRDPEFFSFTKTLDAYRQTVNAGTTLFIDTHSDFFKYLKSIQQPNSP